MSPFVSYCLWSCVALAAIFAVSRLLLPRLLAARGVTLRRRTMFGPALVFEAADEDGTPVRMLNVGGAFQSASYISAELRHEPVCLYHRVFARVLRDNGLVGEVSGAFGPEAGGAARGSEMTQDAGAPGGNAARPDGAVPGGNTARPDGTGGGRVLVLGGGGYSLPRWLAMHTQAQVEAVEIDPAITELAREFFFLSEAEDAAEGRLLLPNADGWTYLLADKDRYRAIVNDAFSRNRPLGPMKTDEGARHIHEHLAEDGVYLANVIASLEGRHSRVLAETLAVFRAEFAHVYLVPERPEEPRRRACNVLVASDAPLVVPDGVE